MAFSCSRTTCAFLIQEQESPSTENKILDFKVNIIVEFALEFHF